MIIKASTTYFDERKHYVVRLLLKLNELQRKRFRRQYINLDLNIKGSCPICHRDLLFNYFKPLEQQLQRSAREELQHIEVWFADYANCELVADLIFYE